MLFITHEFHFAPLADNFHTGALIPPMRNYLLLAGELTLATQLAIGLKPRQLTVFAHVGLKFVVGEGGLTQVTLEDFGVQP